jgi:hypothetical protein
MEVVREFEIAHKFFLRSLAREYRVLFPANQRSLEIERVKVEEPAISLHIFEIVEPLALSPDWTARWSGRGETNGRRSLFILVCHCCTAAVT